MLGEAFVSILRKAELRLAELRLAELRFVDFRRANPRKAPLRNAEDAGAAMRNKVQTRGWKLTASIAIWWFALAAMIPVGSLAQSDPIAPSSAQQNTVAAEQSRPIVTTREKWNNFVSETASPLTLGGGAFNAIFSQVTHTDPDYGNNGKALAERFGASIADIATQNFYGDFVVASILREDPRYFRMGAGHGFWTRAGYAVSRALVIRSDSGGNTFNFDNVIGSGASTLTSNFYYPPASSTGRGMLMHWGIDVADNGFVNLAPEFWPDFRDKVLRRKRKAPPQP